MFFSHIISHMKFNWLNSIIVSSLKQLICLNLCCYLEYFAYIVISIRRLFLLKT